MVAGVGLVGAAQFIPLLAARAAGGALADAFDRAPDAPRRLGSLTLRAVPLMVNALLPDPQLSVLFVIAALLAGLHGVHPPALEAMMPRLVDRAQAPRRGALMAAVHHASAIVGPALAGV